MGASYDKLAPAELADYLARRAKELRGETVVVHPAWARAYVRLLQAYQGNRCLLMVVTDHVLLTFADVVGVTERLLTPGVFDIAVKELGGFEQPWEVLYYRRFADTPDEGAFFATWLSVLEDTLTANHGSEPRIGNNVYESWDAVREIAQYRLQGAVTAVKERLLADD